MRILCPGPLTKSGFTVVWECLLFRDPFQSAPQRKENHLWEHVLGKRNDGPSPGVGGTQQRRLQGKAGRQVG